MLGMAAYFFNLTSIWETESGDEGHAQLHSMFETLSQKEKKEQRKDITYL